MRYWSQITLSVRSHGSLLDVVHSRFPRTCSSRPQEGGFHRYWKYHVGMGNVLPTLCRHCVLLVGRRAVDEKVADQDCRVGTKSLVSRAKETTSKRTDSGTVTSLA